MSMSRRRYLSSEISTDDKVNSLSDRAALLYTWSLPHFADNCRLTPKNAAECRWTIFPGRKCTDEQVEDAMNELFSTGLWGRDENARIFIPSESFYKYQTYINAEKRRETPQIAASPSPSPSPTLKEDPYSPQRGRMRVVMDSGFEKFWDAYPRKVGKGRAYRMWRSEVKNAIDTQAAIFTALEWQVKQDQWSKDGGQYIPHPATWLHDHRWQDAIATDIYTTTGKTSEELAAEANEREKKREAEKRREYREKYAQR
jgi:hypothetical protein